MRTPMADFSRLLNLASATNAGARRRYFIYFNNDENERTYYATAAEARKAIKDMGLEKVASVEASDD